MHSYCLKNARNLPFAGHDAQSAYFVVEWLSKNFSPQGENEIS
jgi:hypothetical protein